jgi:hypothetical protein
MIAAKRAVLTGYSPILAAAPWFTLDELSGLRDLLVRWGRVPAGPHQLPRQREGYRGEPERRRGALAVGVDDEGWRELLDHELGTRKAAVLRTVAERIPVIQSRCVAELSAGRGCYGLPALLDRELHALSVRATRRLETDAAAVTAAICAQLLGTTPEQDVLALVAAALRQVVEADVEARPARALILTTTAGVAAVTGRAATDALAVLRPTVDDSVLAPIGGAVSPSCYQLWQHRDPQGVSRCRPWLTRALQVVEGTISGELGQRYGELHRAIATVATDAVDHGFLLV